MEVIKTARELPPEWDTLCGDNPYLHREFLRFIESTDTCEQLYALFRNPDSTIDSILMTYVRYKFNLLMFTPIKVALRMTFVYVPLSVTRPGIVCGEKTARQVGDYCRSIPGFVLFLNTSAQFMLPGFTRLKTFPRCMLDIRWNTFNEYLSSLRSGYRHRYKKALSRSNPLSYRILDNNSAFDDRLYALYEEVYAHSPYKIEKLSIDFFRGPFFKIGVFEKEGTPVGFVQMIENGPELIFEFVGFDHSFNNENDIYISLLLKIIEYGIDHTFARIDFGQTADEAKLKLGCRYEPLYALLRHSNPLLNAILGICSRTIEYTPLDEHTFHVFRTTESPDTLKETEKT